MLNQYINELISRICTEKILLYLNAQKRISFQYFYSSPMPYNNVTIAAPPVGLKTWNSLMLVMQRVEIPVVIFVAVFHRRGRRV